MKTVGRRERSQQMPQLMVLARALVSTAPRPLIRIVTMSDKTKQLDVTITGQLSGGRTIVIHDGTASTETARPSRQRDDGRNAITGMTTSGGIETTTCGVGRGIAMADIATATASDAGAMRRREVTTAVDGTTTTTTTRRTPITVPGTQRGVVLLRGETQSRTQVEMSLLVADTEVETGE